MLGCLVSLRHKQNIFFYIHIADLACPQRRAVLEDARSTARLELADILISGLNYVECVQKCGWSSKYAYAYMNLLNNHNLWPRGLGRQSITCAYGYKHCVPAIQGESSTFPGRS